VRTARLASIALVLLAAPARADPAIEALIAAYPDFLTGSKANMLLWKDGTRMPISDGREGKSFEHLLKAPDIADQFAIPYPLGGTVRTPRLNEDPGRIRYQPFFVKMYGDCRKGEVARRLKPVRWLPSRGGGVIRATTVNGVADKLAAVSRELERLPAAMTRFMVPSAGTYNCRAIAHTSRLSVHAFGAAIDLNAHYADYWQWARRIGGKIPWKNRLPAAIVEIFERHGFIWGGKWYHYDTMHFEYRPELIDLAKRGSPPDTPRQ
jgi:D-alanyl-D-alanine carboxypeptidase